LGLNLADALVDRPDVDLQGLLLEACIQAATDFPGAVASLQPRLGTHAEDCVKNFVATQLSIPDPGAVACAIYLLAQAHSADLAAAAGWHALELGCDDDHVIIALADILHVQADPRQSAPAMMHARASDSRSSSFLIKLADHYRTSGQAFLAEDALRGLIRRGRDDLLVRLAELWIEWDDWPSARAVLQSLPGDRRSAYSSYLIGRCAASLLLEDEVIRCIDALMNSPEPGPLYAALLRCVWNWRVGDPAAAARACPAAAFPPLLARDADSLRRAAPEVTNHGPTDVWRDIGPRHDLPNVLGIGMQRTATTWLWRQITGHPDVQAQTFKEPVFFSGFFASPNRPGSDLRDAVLGKVGDLYWQGPTRSLLHYRKIFANDKRFRVDISPAYGELPAKSVARVREILGPGVKIILSVRDPVERSWSNFKLNLRYTGEHPLNFSFAQRIAAYRNVATIRRCDYASVLRKWKRYFEDVMVVFMDDVVARPDETFAEIRRFIGLSEWINGDSARPVNSSDALDMPRDDRMFLFGLHQPTYDAAEAELGGPARAWRQRQLELLSAPHCPASGNDQPRTHSLLSA
jgi:Sulfotransferase family